MHKTVLVSVLFALGLPLAQSISVSGTVSGPTGTPVAGALVSLLGRNLSDTTDAAGKYSLVSSSSPVNPGFSAAGKGAASLERGVLRIELREAIPLAIERFDVHGDRIGTPVRRIAPAGEYRLDLRGPSSFPGLQFVRVTLGERAWLFRFMPLGNGAGAAILSPSAPESRGPGPLAKAQAVVDSLKVTAAGYATAVTLIASYQSQVDVKLEAVPTVACDPNDKTPAPVAVNTSFSGKAFTGTHEVVVETDPGISGVTIFRPKDLGAGKAYPILAWGQGGCSKNGLTNREFQAEIASQGYLVFSDGAPNGSGSGSSSSDLKVMGKPLLDYIHFAIKENRRPCSQYYHSLDTAKTAAFGWSCGGLMAEGAGASNDPALTTFMLNSSGMQSFNQSIIDAFKTPVMIILGGPDDIAYANGTKDYEAVKNVPAMLLSTNVGHGGTYDQDNGGSFAKVDVAWLNWWLKGDTGPTGKGYLVGANCGLCSDTKWTIKSKNIP